LRRDRRVFDELEAQGSYVETQSLVVVAYDDCDLSNGLVHRLIIAARAANESWQLQRCTSGEACSCGPRQCPDVAAGCGLDAAVG
jgi:hypothetical protein